MKKLYTYIIIIAIGVIALNICFYRDIYLRQISYQKNILFQQAEKAGNEIESVVSKFESDINKILFSDDIAEILSSNDVKESGMRKLKLFYSTYADQLKPRP